MYWLSLHCRLYKRGGQRLSSGASCARILTHKRFTVLLRELIKSICRDLQRNWHVIFMSFLCGYLKISVNSFIPFLWFQSSAPQPTPTPPIWSPFGWSNSTSTFARIPLFQLRPPLPFPKRELHFHMCAALSAGSATPPYLQQATSFKGCLQIFPSSKT